MADHVDASVEIKGNRVITLTWGPVDRVNWVTIVGVIGLTLATLMAVFGLPPIDLHGPLHRMGVMDPFCGGTRAARLTAQGNFAGAWRYNPLGIVATVAALLATLRLAIGLTAKRWLDVVIAWTPPLRALAIGITIALLVLLEIRQQGRSDLLLRSY